jgi:hypothetical protein
MDQLALERMLTKLSTRRYPAGLEPVGSSVQQTAGGTFKLAVSRRFVARTGHAVAELLAIDLTGLDLVALMVDGIRVAERRCVVALGITLDGAKIPLALAEGATENALSRPPPSSFDAEDAPGLVASVFGRVRVEPWDAPLVRLPDRDAVRDYLIARFVAPEVAVTASERVTTPTWSATTRCSNSLMTTRRSCPLLRM